MKRYTRNQIINQEIIEDNADLNKAKNTLKYISDRYEYKYQDSNDISEVFNDMYYILEQEGFIESVYDEEENEEENEEESDKTTSPDIIINIYKGLDYYSLLPLCSSNKHFSDICADEDNIFWKNMLYHYVKKRSVLEYIEEHSGKEIYQYYFDTNFLYRSASVEALDPSWRKLYKYITNILEDRDGLYQIEVKKMLGAYPRRDYLMNTYMIFRPYLKKYSNYDIPWYYIYEEFEYILSAVGNDKSIVYYTRLGKWYHTYEIGKDEYLDKYNIHYHKYKRIKPGLVKYMPVRDEREYTKLTEKDKNNYMILRRPI